MNRILQRSIWRRETKLVKKEKPAKIEDGKTKWKTVRRARRDNNQEKEMINWIGEKDNEWFLQIFRTACQSEKYQGTGIDSQTANDNNIFILQHIIETKSESERDEPL
ncbi:hypothetical protein ILUMI_23289 [Ignelater luminosus]|uniref:Uncharacterized protein n=1 Tax=Ignelater luminosus TaxID=2038154 RepID=A0A8K0C917_IGNLU|nr:hypothetical protein ILUMI_23289 [Ignelater luminosus]